MTRYVYALIVCRSVGDVWVELPGKSGFIYSPESIPTNMTTEQVQTIGLDINGTLPIPLLVDLNNQTLYGPDAEYIPESVQEEVKSIDTFYTTARGGILICETYNSPAGLSSRGWRPYNYTLGWHYTLWGTCSPAKGWSSNGFDASVDIRGECNPEASTCLQVQTFRPGNAFYGSMIQSVSVKVSGGLTEDQIQACCFPATEAERDCTAVTEIVDSYVINNDDSQYSVLVASSDAPWYSIASSMIILMMMVLL